MAYTDGELIKGIKKGDDKSLEIFYNAYSGLLYAFICHQLKKNSGIVHDVYQETWLAALENIGSLRSKSHFFTWLCAIARNKVADHFRDSAKLPLSEDFTTYHSDLSYQEWPEDGFREEMLAHVVETLGNVNPVYRNLLMARYIDNKSVEEISALSGKSYKAAESLLSRAREAFRKKFQENKGKNE